MRTTAGVTSSAVIAAAMKAIRRFGTTDGQGVVGPARLGRPAAESGRGRRNCGAAGTSGFSATRLAGMLKPVKYRFFPPPFRASGSVKLSKLGARRQRADEMERFAGQFPGPRFSRCFDGRATDVSHFALYAGDCKAGMQVAGSAPASCPHPARVVRENRLADGPALPLPI